MARLTTLTSAYNKLRLLALLGLSAPLWLTWGVGRLTDATYRMKDPLRASMYAPSFVVGFLAGVAAAVLSQESPIKGWVVFFISLLVGAAVQSVLTGVALSDCLAAFFGSYGSLLFWAGSWLWPAFAYLRRGRKSAP